MAITAAIPATSRPYSTAEAPRSLLACIPSPPGRSEGATAFAVTPSRPLPTSAQAQVPDRLALPLLTLVAERPGSGRFRLVRGAPAPHQQSSAGAGVQRIGRLCRPA